MISTALRRSRQQKYIIPFDKVMESGYWHWCVDKIGFSWPGYGIFSIWQYFPKFLSQRSSDGIFSSPFYLWRWQRNFAWRIDGTWDLSIGARFAPWKDSFRKCFLLSSPLSVGANYLWAMILIFFLLYWKVDTISILVIYVFKSPSYHRKHYLYGCNKPFQFSAFSYSL